MPDTEAVPPVSGRANTIRYALGPRVRAPEHLREAHFALDALVAENQQQAQKIYSLAAELVHAGAERSESQAENQQLRDALERIGRMSVRSGMGRVEYGSLVAAADIARAALAGTPSEDTE